MILQKKNTKPLADKMDRAEGSLDSGITMLMEAGAGTGKTSVLISRILDIIKRGIAPIHRIVAITFTEKAAGEMVVRLRDALEKFLSEPDPPGTDGIKWEAGITNVRKALDDFENHRISTIHSFAASLLRETPFEADVDPAFEVIDEIDEQEIIDELWEQWLQDQITDTSGSLYICYHLELKTDFFKILFDKLFANRDHLAGFTPVKTHVNLTGAVAEIGAVVEQLTDLIRDFRNTEDKGYLDVQNFHYRFQELHRLKDLDIVRSLLNWEIRKGTIKSGDKKSWGAEGKERKMELCQLLQERLEEFRNTYTRWLLDSCTATMLEFLEAVEREKREKRVLTFDDMLIKTRNLLRDNEHIREYYKSKFTRILVDEFQDTDPLQAEIVFYLSEEKGRFENTWSQCVLEKGKLFLVGDPKQSIYAFRRADIEIYDQVKDLVASSGKLGKLITNFRTLKPVISWVNDQFSLIIRRPDDGGRYQPAYEPLTPFRQEMEYPSLWILKPDLKMVEQLRTPYMTRSMAAEASAAFIKELVEEKKFVIRHKDGKQKPLSYGDIAILFPTFIYLPGYEEALRKRNIPFILEGGRQFYERPEVKEILYALKAIDNPRDEISLAATLRSSLFGLSDEDLLTLRVKGIPFCYTEATGSEHPAAAAFEKLRTLHELKSQASVGRLVEELYEITLAREFALTVHKDNRRAANQDKFLLIARQYDRHNRGTLRSFIYRVENEPEEGSKEPDAQLSEPGTDAVQLMTYHKSKGLEFPVVILAIPVGKGGRTSWGGFLLFNRADSRFEIEKKNAGGKVYLVTEGYQELKELTEEKEAAEKARLLYVACTRARDLLILPAFFQTKFPGAASDGVSDEGTENGEEPETAEPEKKTAKKKDSKKGESDVVKVEASFMQQLLMDTIGDGMPDLSGAASEAPPAGAEKPAADLTEGEPACRFASQFSTVACSEEMLSHGHVAPEKIRFDGRGKPETREFTDRFDEWLREREDAIRKGSEHLTWKSYTSEKRREDDGIQESKDDAGRRFGRAFHMVMSQVDLKGEQPFDSLVQLACTGERVEDRIDEVKQLVQKTLESNVILRMRKARTVHREFPFSVNKDMHIYHGAIDALFREDGDIVIIDFKTDNVPAGGVKAAAEKYCSQAEIYKTAIEKIAKEHVKSVLMYFVRNGETVEMIQGIAP